MLSKPSKKAYSKAILSNENGTLNVRGCNHLTKRELVDDISWSSTNMMYSNWPKQISTVVISWERWDHSVCFFSSGVDPFSFGKGKRNVVIGRQAIRCTCKLQVVTRFRNCWSGCRGSNNLALEPAWYQTNQWKDYYGVFWGGRLPNVLYLRVCPP